MWKNGQIVTVRGKKCRVKSESHGFLACNLCALCCDTDTDCNSICLSEESKLNGNQYLEEIPAKGKSLGKVNNSKIYQK